LAQGSKESRSCGKLAVASRRCEQWAARIRGPRASLARFGAMSEANKDEASKCKQIAMNALKAGDRDKAVRFFQKAKRMDPGDASIDSLIAQAESTPASGDGASGGNPGGSTEPEGVRHRASAQTASAPAGESANARTDKAGKAYTAEQMSDVQRILRTKDYYQILGVSRDANEDAIKKAYRKGAVKLHPDKNSAPGSVEAFKKFSKAYQCLADADKKRVYDQYGDEDRVPQQHRHHYHQDVSPEDLFAQFFGGGAFHHAHFHGGRHHQQQEDGAPLSRANIFQMLPVLLLVILTLFSNLNARDGGRFSFTPSGVYTHERHSAALNVAYYVTGDFDNHYPDGTQALRDFERQVEIFHVRQLQSECDYQEKAMYKKVMMAKRRNNPEELSKARKYPRPACEEIAKIKKGRHANIYRSALYMGAY